MAPWGGFFIWLLLLVFSLAILAGLSRWIFRINAIVARLDKMIELMGDGEGAQNIPTGTSAKPVEDSSSYRMGRKLGQFMKRPFQLAIFISGCLLPAPALAADQVDVLDQDGRRQGYAVEGSGRMDLYDARSNRTGYGVQRPDGSVDLFRPDGSRLGTIQPGTGSQPSRIILPKGKR